MADFSIAHAITAKNEGGYANNPHDTGGETLFGVSRNNFPAWPGWALVDSVKRTNPTGYVAILNAHSGLRQLAHDLYKTSFWDVLRLDPVKDQLLANAVYDFGVNAGPARSAGLLQRAVNVTNRGGGNVAVDSKMGPATVAALNAHSRPALVRQAFAFLRGSFYISIAEKNPAQEIFIPSWFSRISL